MAKNNVQSGSYLLCTQVIKPQTIQKNTKSVMIQIYINKTYTNIGHKIFEELVPSASHLLKKAHKARTSWYRGPFRRFINTRLKKKKKV